MNQWAQTMRLRCFYAVTAYAINPSRLPHHRDQLGRNHIIQFRTRSESSTEIRLRHRPIPVADRPGIRPCRTRHARIGAESRFEPGDGGRMVLCLRPCGVPGRRDAGQADEIRENVLIITTSLADPQADARRTAFPAAGSPEATARTTRHRPAKSLSLLRFVGQKPQDDIVRFRLRPTETGGAEDRSPG